MIKYYKNITFIKLPWIFIPKYRRKVLYGQLRADIRKIIIKLCKYKNVEIIEGAVCKDHVNVCVSIPSKERVWNFVWYLKGRCAIQIFDKHPEYRNKWHQEFCARGYYVTTVGDIIKPNHISHRFLKLIRRNKMKEIRFHDLRHTLGTGLNANGMDLKAIGKFLGHWYLSITKRYSHPDDRIKQNVASAYENLIHSGQDNKQVSKNQKSKQFIVKRKNTAKQMQEVMHKKNSTYITVYTIRFL